MKIVKHLTFLIYCLVLLITSANASEITEQFLSNPGSSQGFEENKGQVLGDEAEEVLFVHKAAGISIFLMPTAIVYQFENRAGALGGSADRSALSTDLLLKPGSQKVQTYRMDMQLIGSNPEAKICTYEQSGDFSNYNKSKSLKVYSYQRIVYENIYPKIDWVVYQNEDQIKYDFIVRPGGDPTLIQIKAKWVEDISIDESGNLLLENRLGSVLEQRPISFQQGKRIETDFVLEDDVVSFDIADYDPSKKLIIDPEIEWGTYYGGSGTEGFNSVTTDTLGNVYACGTTYGSDSLASGGFQYNNPTLMGGIGAAYLVKFNSEGDRLWATYYSGDSFTGAISVAIDAQQNAYMTGFTYDSGLSFNGFQNSRNGPTDAFLIKINPEGERLWATYFGGSDSEVARTVTVDNQNNVYITGKTNSSDFLVIDGFQETPGDEIGLSGDAFLAKFDSSGDLIWSTFFGGSEREFAFYVSCDNLDNVYITGATSSTAGISFDGHQQDYGGGQSDAFLAKYNEDGVLQWSSYYGGSGEDVTYGLVTDQHGNVFICGETGSSDNIASNGFQETYAAAFLAKFSADGNREWGTYYGSGIGGPGSGSNVGYACAVDMENNVYMAGTTNSTAGISSEGFQNSFGGGSSDAYIASFTPIGGRRWGSYYGGSDNDLARGMHIDETSTIYIAGTTQSADGIFFNGFQSSQENETGFVSKIRTCPNPRLIGLPEEICAGTRLELNPFPEEGSLVLFGEGQIKQSTYIAPDVMDTITVSLQYTTAENGPCPSAVASFELTILPTFTASVSLTTATSEICEGDNVSVLANTENVGSDPNITWFLNGQVVQQGGITFDSKQVANNDLIQVEVESSDLCAASNPIVSNSILFIVNPIPDINVVFTDLEGGTLVTDFGFTSYQWFLDGVIIPDATLSTFTPSVIGIYEVVVTNEFNCESSASISVLSISPGELAEKGLSIYPNPSDGLLTLNFKSQTPESYTIFNSIGQAVYLNSEPTATELLDLRMLAAGVYLVSFDIDGSRCVEKIVVL